VTTDAQSPRGLWRFTGPVVRRLLVLAALGTAAAALGAWAWPLELPAHFRWQMLVVSAICAGLALGARRPKEVAVASLLVALNAWGVAPSMVSPAQAHTATLKLVHLNVQMDSDAKDRAARWLAETQPDIVTLVEVDTAWFAALAQALPELAYHHAAPRSDFLGLAVLSRYPITEARAHRAAPGGLPWLETRLDVEGQPLTLVSLHALPPMGATWVHASEALLRDIAGARPDLGPRVMVCGDFNLTPWSPSLTDFADAASLHDVGAGRALRGTWPAAFAPMRIPIDLCFASDGVATAGVSEGPDLGSDHLPVLVRLGR
jgi:endonuclease/exonuclease/phosphatase (EEP) superfamily protein YafD